MKSTHKSIKTLVDLLEYRASDSPDKVSHIFLKDGENDEERITYGELSRKSKIIAARLLQSSEPGDRALLMYPPGLEYIIAYFGCLYAGVIAVPVYPPDPIRVISSLKRLKAIIKNADPGVTLTASSVSGMVEILLPQLYDNIQMVVMVTDKHHTLFQKSNHWCMPDIHSESLAFLQYTSGSTGSPKGVMVSHGNLINNMSMTASWYNFDNRSPRGVSWLPPYHDMGLIGGILQPIYQDVPVILMSPLAFLQKPFRWLKAISHYKATITAGPNFSFDLCTRKIPPGLAATLDLSSLEMVVNGAEPVRPDVLQRFSETFEHAGFSPKTFAPAYGLAENTLFCAGVAKKESPLVRKFSENGNYSKQVVSCGQSSEEQTVVVVDPETGTALSDGNTGELWIKGKSVAKGYWNRPEETDTIFKAYTIPDNHGPFLRTGDTGFIENNHIFVTGRLKDLIIIRGKNHAPQDIEETVASAHLFFRPGCTAAFSTEQNGEEKLVVVQEVKKEFHKPENTEKLFSDIRLAVSTMHQVNVSDIKLIKAGTIPKTSSGKIQRFAAKALYLKNKLDVIRVRENSKNKPASNEKTGFQDIVYWVINKTKEFTTHEKETINPSKSPIHHGFDSLTLVEFNTDINTEFEVDLSISFLADANTSLTNIAYAIQELVLGKTSLTVEEDLLKNIDTMSEDELNYLLETL